MRVLIWGTGKGARNWIESGNVNDDEVVGCVDNNPQNVLNEKIPTYAPDQIKNLCFDKIIISSDIYFEDIKKQLMVELKMPEEKITDRWQNLKEKMIQKYMGSADGQIQETLMYWKTHRLSVFNQYECNDNETYAEVIWDDEVKMSYIIFENKRMYFPSEYRFYQKNGKRYVKNILSEQSSASPHLYLKKESDIKQGCVLVDAGACEWNFALRFIDRVSKVYLIESDRKWMEALKITFKDYSDKVVFCEKSLGKEDTKESITLDSLVKENIDFLKMDIEGAEIEALLGARATLCKSNARCAICSYHNSNDEKYIRFILENYGYKTDVSNGYMIFIHDPNIFEKADFRRGVVYAEKNRDER